MRIVDTTVWIDYLRGVHNAHTDWLEANVSREPLGLTDLILFEILQGLADQKSFARVQAHLAPFPVYDTGGSEMAVAAAKNYIALRGHGCTVRKSVDCLIATFCIRSGYSLLHHDRDYAPFERFLGLAVIHP
jgi:predicted nucleic acid-binding protein